MIGLLEALLKFFTDFDFKRLVLLLCLLIAFVVGLSAYERYTSSFQFSRLQRAADLLARLQEIEMNKTNSTPQLDFARTALYNQAVQAIETEPRTLDLLPSSLSLPTDAGWKFLAGSSFWIFVALTLIPKLRDQTARKTVFGLLLFGFASGALAVFVPTIWWPWFHIFIFPLVFFLFASAALIPFVIYPTFSKARKAAQQNACRLNLMQIDGATHQWALENKKLANDVPSWEDIRPYLVKIPVCPCGGKYTLGSGMGSPQCSLASSGHALESSERI